jgi:perosamine synthetase
MTALAMLGGAPVRKALFPAYNVIGEAEKAAAMRVLDSGVLSRFLGTWHPDFNGGPEVQAFESEWAALNRVKHAVAVNSCTSGLYAAVGASGVGPGDEVIVSPFTMVASATAALVFNAVPVFADIDPRTFCLSPDSIAERITPRTKAIIVVHIMGQSADMDPIMELAERHGLIVIEDCAQAPFATYKGRPVGALGHMGVFSLNYHKHIHTGEGGMVTTDDDDLAQKVRLIRNHAEAVVEGSQATDLTNMVGFNFRLGEIEAAIGRALLDKAPALIAQRRDNVAYLESRLSPLPHITLAYTPQHNEHVYYVHTLSFDWQALGIRRETFVQALRAELPGCEMREHEGPLIGQGYVKPIYLMPMYQTRTAYGSVQCPFRCPHYEGGQEYAEGLCPNTEQAHATIICHEMMRPPMTRADLDDVADAFEKVCGEIDALRAWERKAKP